MKQINFNGQDGPQLVSTLVVNKELAEKFTWIEVENVLKAFKNVLIQALEKRAAICFSKMVENTERIIDISITSISYVSIDNAVNTYSQASYDIMPKTVQLIKDNKWAEITSHGWCQIIKALYWVKPVNKEVTNEKGETQLVTFANLISIVLEYGVSAAIKLYNKKD